MSTFGHGSVTTSTKTCYENWKYLAKETVGEGGTATSMSMYCDGTAAGVGDQSFVLCLYDDDGDSGMPGTLLGQTSAFVVPDNGEAAWRGADLVSAVEFTAGNYWIGPICGSTSGSVKAYYYSVTSGIAREISDTYSDGPANPTAAGSADNKSHLVLVTYTATPSGISIPLLNNLLLGD